MAFGFGVSLPPSYWRDRELATSVPSAFGRTLGAGLAGLGDTVREEEKLKAEISQRDADRAERRRQFDAELLQRETQHTADLALKRASVREKASDSWGYWMDPVTGEVTATPDAATPPDAPGSDGAPVSASMRGLAATGRLTFAKPYDAAMPKPEPYADVMTGGAGQPGPRADSAAEASPAPTALAGGRWTRVPKEAYTAFLATRRYGDTTGASAAAAAAAKEEERRQDDAAGRIYSRFASDPNAELTPEELDTLGKSPRFATAYGALAMEQRRRSEARSTRESKASSEAADQAFYAKQYEALAADPTLGLKPLDPKTGMPSSAVLRDSITRAQGRRTAAAAREFTAAMAEAGQDRQDSRATLSSLDRALALATKHGADAAEHYDRVLQRASAAGGVPGSANENPDAVARYAPELERARVQMELWQKAADEASAKRDEHPLSSAGIKTRAASLTPDDKKKIHAVTLAAPAAFDSAKSAQIWLGNRLRAEGIAFDSPAAREIASEILNRIDPERAKPATDAARAGVEATTNRYFGPLFGR